MDELEVKLDDRSRLRLALTKRGMVSVQILKPGNDADGHGLFYTAGGFIEGAELQALLASLTPAESDAGA